MISTFDGLFLGVTVSFFGVEEYLVVVLNFGAVSFLGDFLAVSGVRDFLAWAGVSVLNGDTDFVCFIGESSTHNSAKAFTSEEGDEDNEDDEQPRD